MSTISPIELNQKLDSAQPPVIIDVREPWEFEEYNIKGVLYPLYTLPERIDELDSYKHAEIVVHCKSGKRSHQARKFLLKNGFSSVKSLEGGIEAYLMYQSKQ